MNGQALLAGFETLKSGTLWHNPTLDAKHPCKGFADANPGEADQITAYVNELAARGKATPPALVTKTGRGLVGIIDAMAASPATGAVYPASGVYPH